MDATVLLYTVPQEELDIPEKEILRYLGYQVRGITEDDLAMVRTGKADGRGDHSDRRTHGILMAALRFFHGFFVQIMIQYKLVISYDKQL